jgi:hypothetical protein
MSDEESNNSGSERLSQEVFDRIRYEYETGQKNLGDLAEEAGVSRQGLSRRLKRAGAVKNSRIHELKKPENAPEPDKSYSANRAKWIEETRVSGFNALKQAQIIARKTVADAVRSNQSLATIDDDLKAIQRYNKTLADNILATLNLLDADNYIDEEDLPQLLIQDLTDEEILEHHKATGALPEDATIEDLNSEEIVAEEI